MSHFDPNRAKLLNGVSSRSGTYYGIAPAGTGTLPGARPISPPGTIRSMFLSLKGIKAEREI